MPITSQNQAAPPLKKTCLEENKMLAALLSIEPEKVYAMPDPSITEGELKFKSTLSDLADRELVATIGWAKQVPGFVNLPLSDQMILLQTTWLDILCLNQDYRSSPYKGLIVFADDFQCAEKDIEKYVGPLELDRISRKVAKKMSELNITREEYVFLKAMLLFNPDIDHLESPTTIQQLRDRMHDSFMEYERARAIANQRRVGSLLMILPLLTHQRLLACHFWHEVKRDGRVQLHKLLSEMLEFVPKITS